MAGSEFLERVNQQYFDGQLSNAQIGFLSELDTHNVEATALIESILARMSRLGVGAKDITECIFREMVTTLPRVQPGAWGGVVPPITFPGRHVLIEDYMQMNRWNPATAGGAILDVGCGFPPVTTVDLAKRFPDAKIIGCDPSFGKYIVTDSEGSYASFLQNGQLQYFQRACGTIVLPWDKAAANLDDIKRHFTSLFKNLKKGLPHRESDDTCDEYQRDGCYIVRNPLGKYSAGNLSFEQKGIGDAGLPVELDMIRCMNVLVYFDPVFRAKTVNWAHSVLREGGLLLCGFNITRSINCRFSAYQKERNAMQFREFAFSIENLRPLQVSSYFSLRDDDFELEQQEKYVKLIRQNAAFMQGFNSGFDRLLKQLGIGSRDEDGYLKCSANSLNPDQLQMEMYLTFRRLGREFSEGAVEVLRRLGTNAWVNEIGFISVGDQKP